MKKVAIFFCERASVQIWSASFEPETVIIKKQIENKLEKFPQLINTIKGALDKNIIVALQLIYHIDTKDSKYSDELLRHSQSDAIYMLSTVLDSIKPNRTDKYFNESIICHL